MTRALLALRTRVRRHSKDACNFCHRNNVSYLYLARRSEKRKGKRTPSHGNTNHPWWARGSRALACGSCSPHWRGAFCVVRVSVWRSAFPFFFSDFNNSFAVTFADELQKMLEQNLPPQLESVATLPCEIWMFNSANLQHVIRCKCDTESFIYIICLSDMLNSVSHVYAN